MPEYEQDEQEEGGILPRSSPMNMPQPNEDFFKYRIDGKDIIDEIDHMLKGEVWDSKKGMYEQKFDRWANDEGINKFIATLYACGINKNIFLGNLTKEEIMTRCYMLKAKLSLLLFKKYRDYEVSREMRGLLVTNIIYPIHSALSRSEGGRESGQISTAAQRHDIYSYQEQKGKSSILKPRLPFFGGRG